MIELVLVIVILGVLAAIAIPRFIDLQSAATEAQEDATIAALKEAITINCMNNIVNGTGNWPCKINTENPFSLLEHGPNTINWNGGGSVPSTDNVSWRYLYRPGYWGIFCPHYNGNWAGGISTTPSRGRCYRYYYSGAEAGKVEEIANWGH